MADDEIGDDSTQPVDGRYRIHWVSRLTGVPEATLRAWERRYQVPKPARTPSGYRVYSASDVALVKRMNELCASGISPNEAAALAAAERQSVPEAAGEDIERVASDEVRFIELAPLDRMPHQDAVSSGQLLSWMDKAAFLAAVRAARKHVVTARSEPVDFHAKVREQQIVEIVARVTRIQRGTMVVEVEVFAETLLTGERALSARGSFHMAVVDEPP